MNYPLLDLVVLKGIISNKQYALDFVSSNSVYIFDTSLWNTTTLILNYIKTYKDVPTLHILTEKLSKTTPALIATMTTIWKQIEATPYNEKEYKFNLDSMRQRFSTNEILKLKERFQSLDVEKINPSKIIDDLKQTIHTVNGVVQSKTYEQKTLKDSIAPFREEIAAKLKNPEFDNGILTHYSFLDNATGGIRPSELLIVGGESSSGKSLLLMNIALQMWMQDNTIDTTESFSTGHNVLYFSLEMPFKSCRNRIYSCLSGVPTKLIKQPVSKEGKSRLTQEDRDKLKKALQFIDKYPYQFEIVDIPRGATMERIEQLFEESKAKYNPEIIAIDYLGLLEDDSKEDDWLKLGAIAGKCHEFCRAQNVIGLTAVQLNRTKASSKDAEEKVGLHRVGRSALIMTHANWGLQIETRPSENKYPDMIVHMIKSRDGELGKGKLLKNLACGTLIDENVNADAPDFNFTNFDDLSEKIEKFDI